MPQTKANDCKALRDFLQKVRCISTWLKSTGYLQTFSAVEFTVKTVTRLTNCLRNSFYQCHSNAV